MTRGRRTANTATLAVVVVCAAVLPRAGPDGSGFAQQSSSQSQPTPIIEFPNLGPVPGGGAPALGPPPGAFDPGDGPGTPGIVGGRGRRGRVPPPGTRGIRPGVADVRSAGLDVPESLPPPAQAARGRGLLPGGGLDAIPADDEGAPDGLALDAAIERMMHANLDIRALRHELPQADADIVTAGLRTNPLVYMDTQFIPYGSFSDARPGGPTQYDVNITYPLDVSRKRQARVVVARMARSAVEAQFQDVVRRQIDNLYRAFVGLQAARLGLLAADAAVQRQEHLLAAARAQPGQAPAERARRVAKATYEFEQARLARIDAEEALADAQESLAVILGDPPETTGRLLPKGSLRGPALEPPPLEELTRVALESRPDLRAQRIGLGRANAEVALQRANRFDDVYLFYDPFTYQDNRPARLASARSWSVGLTFTLPIYNRNQGNIARATSNVQQTRNEISSLERRVVSEVRLAEREFQAARRALEQIERTMLPLARESLARNAADFAAGAVDAEHYQAGLEDAAELAAAQRDALVRYRRAALDLNTAVGLRIMP